MSSPVLSPVPPTPAKHRPVGLILAAIALALISAWGLLSACSIVFTAIVMRSQATPQLAPNVASVMVGVQIGMAVIALLISAFCAFTVVGLFRIQRWARISILILGGLLALFSALFSIGSIALAFSSAVATGATPGASPATIKIVFLVMGSFFFFSMLIGIWWLVYFNLRRIRVLFSTAAVPLQLDPTAYELPADPALTVATPATGRSVIEILIACLAALYIFGSLSGVFIAFLHFPLFFFGITFRGTSSLLLSAFFIAVSLFIGIGLLRRIRFAWITAVAFQVLGLISSILFFIPAYRARMVGYQQEITLRMLSGFSIPPQQQNQAFQATSYIFGAFIAVLMCSAILWLLLRARPLFAPKS